MLKSCLAFLCRSAVGIIIIYFLVKSNKLNFDVISIINKKTASLALSLCILQFFLAAWRVQLLLLAKGIRINFYSCLFYNAVGVFYSIFLPGGMSGDAMRAYYLYRATNSHYFSKSALIGALVTDRLIGTLAMLFVGLIALTYSQDVLNIPVKYIITVWSFFIGGFAIYIKLCKIPHLESSKPILQWVFKKLKNILSALDLTSYSSRTLLFAWGSSVIIHVCAGLIIFIFSVSLISGLSFGQVMAIAPVGLLMNALPISPGGVGVGEQGFEFLFALIGGNFGGNVFMLSRLFLFAPAILGAVCALSLLFLKKNSAVQQGEYWH